MAGNKIKTNLTFSVDSIPLRKGVALDVMTFFCNPFNDVDKINNAYQKIHGVGFEKVEMLSLGYF